MKGPIKRFISLSAAYNIHYVEITLINPGLCRRLYSAYDDDDTLKKKNVKKHNSKWLRFGAKLF